LPSTGAAVGDHDGAARSELLTANRDGAATVKIEWSKVRNTASHYVDHMLHQ
jgi:hypothetical protein